MTGETGRTATHPHWLSDGAWEDCLDRVRSSKNVVLEKVQRRHWGFDTPRSQSAPQYVRTDVFDTLFQMRWTILMKGSRKGTSAEREFGQERNSCDMRTVIVDCRARLQEILWQTRSCVCFHSGTLVFSHGVQLAVYFVSEPDIKSNEEPSLWIPRLLSKSRVPPRGGVLSPNSIDDPCLPTCRPMSRRHLGGQAAGRELRY